MGSYSRGEVMSLLLNMARKLLHTVSESRAFGDLRSEYQSKPIIKYGVWFGIAIVAFYAQVMSFTIFLMIPTAIFLLVIEIKRYKKMRVIKSKDVELQEEFYKYAKKIYTIEIMVLISVYIICKVF